MLPRVQAGQQVRARPARQPLQVARPPVALVPLRELPLPVVQRQVMQPRAVPPSAPRRPQVRLLLRAARVQQAAQVRRAAQV